MRRRRRCFLGLAAPFQRQEHSRPSPGGPPGSAVPKSTGGHRAAGIVPVACRNPPGSVLSPLYPLLTLFVQETNPRKMVCLAPPHAATYRASSAPELHLHSRDGT